MKIVEKMRNLGLMEDIIRYCSKHDFWYGIRIYVNGHRYSSDADEGTDIVRILDGTKYYDQGVFDVEDFIEFCNPGTLTMSFEGPLYDAYNGYDHTIDAESAFTEIGKKYGLYPEQGDPWNLAFYEE